jgi:hypothetical protein
MKTFLRSILAAVSLVTVLGLTTQVAAGQSSASIQATAVVQQALSVTARADLAFGTVTAGGQYFVGTAQPEAGQWSLSGEGNLGVSLRFTLPSQLSGAGTPVPINDWSVLFSPTSTPAGNSFVPISGQAYNGTLSGGALWARIGAMISPPVGSSGSYSASIVLTVAYL